MLCRSDFAYFPSKHYLPIPQTWMVILCTDKEWSPGFVSAAIVEELSPGFFSTAIANNLNWRLTFKRKGTENKEAGRVPSRSVCTVGVPQSTHGHSGTRPTKFRKRACEEMGIYRTIYIRAKCWNGLLRLIPQPCCLTLISEIPVEKLTLHINTEPKWRR